MADDKFPVTENEIDEAVEYYEGIWRTTRSNWRDWDTFYQRKYPLWKTGMRRETYRPSTPTNVIDHAADTQLAFEPRVHREPVGDTDRHKQAAERVETALTAIMIDAGLMETMLPWKQVGRHFLMYGYAPVEAPVFDFSSRPKEPERTDDETDEAFEDRQSIFKANERDWNPIRTRATHPGRVYLDPTEKQPTIAVKQCKMKVRDLEALSHKRSRLKFSQPYDPGDKKLFDMEDVTQYWTLKYQAFRVTGGPMLWVQKNAWGFVPFSHAFAGFGMEGTDGDGFDPARLAIGLLAPITDSIKLQAQRMAAHQTLLMRKAYSAEGSRLDSAEAAQQLARGEDSVLQGERDDFWFLDTPDVQRWMLEVGREVDRDIELGSYTRQLAGIREPGISTVGQQQILSSAGRLKFLGPSIQVQDLASITASRILQLVDRLKRPIGARGKLLKPSDIFHNYNARVTFEVADPQLDLQRRQMGMQEVGLGLKDKVTYWEDDARAENVSEREKRLLRQAVREHPGVINELAREQARAIGLLNEFDAALGVEEEQMQADGRRTPSLGAMTRETPLEDGRVFANGGMAPEIAERPLPPGAGGE